MKNCALKGIAVTGLGFTFFLLFAFTNPAVAQTNKRVSVEADLGICEPVGKFGTKGFNSFSQSLGYGSAMLGFSLGLKIVYPANERTDITFSVGWQRNSQSDAVIKDTIVSRFPGYNQYRVNVGSWSLWNLMIGGNLKIPLLPGRISLLPGIDLGMAKTSAPGYSYFVSYLPYSISGPQPAEGYFGGLSLPWSLCYRVRAELTWQTSSRLYFKGIVSFFHSDPAWKYGDPPQKTAFPISTLNLMIGAGYNF
ncbi:MAG TPA: hypothetical protein VKR32_06565 [Puia sp.]|nr:hypothetical protein [Puia sp.]